jgi:D-arabinose 1-dehydrogenase-like Zn-dependent alcohol dehydrogenase
MPGARARSQGEPFAVHDVTRCHREDGSGCGRVVYRRSEPLALSVFPLIMGRRQMSGWYSGTARDSQDTLEFSALSDVHPMIEKFPAQSRDRGVRTNAQRGEVRFRVVLTMGSGAQQRDG